MNIGRTRRDGAKLRAGFSLMMAAAFVLATVPAEAGSYRRGHGYGGHGRGSCGSGRGCGYGYGASYGGGYGQGGYGYSSYAYSSRPYSSWSYGGGSPYAVYSGYHSFYTYPSSVNYQVPHGYQVYFNSPRYLIPGLQQWNVLTLPEHPDNWPDVERDRAWYYLEEGDFERASEMFAAGERQLPAAAWPKIGSGLLAGLSGHYSRSEYQFRRAFRFDREGPGPLPESEEIREGIERMTAYYQELAQTPVHDEDTEFMLAALAYLRGDYPAARRAAQQAIRRGDTCLSVRHVQALVDKASAAQLAAQER